MNTDINTHLEIDKINLNEFNYLKLKKKIKYKNFLYILFILLNLIVIYNIFLKKTEIINDLLDIKNCLIEKLNSIELKLKIIDKNQKILVNKRNLNIYDFIRPLEVLGYKKIRIGNKSDGGYILLDDFKNIKIAYSFGINNEISFDKELADKNIDVFMYDHTITGIPINNSRLHWKKIGLSGTITKINNIKTLPELLKENGHLNEKNMILKIDIDSYEWDVFHYLPINILNQFKYIVGEFHFSVSKKFNYYLILKRLKTTHQIFHLHCNNVGGVIDLDGYKICEYLEISLIRKKGYKFTKDNSKYPIENLDYKNYKKRSDINFILNFI